MIQCEGQMNLMDLLTPETTPNEAPVMLTEGQKVYKVVRGDVYEHTVGGRTWNCGNNNRGYDLDYDTTWNTQIGRYVFTDRESADKVAAQYLEENLQHILGKDIRTTEVVAYRVCPNERDVIQWYAVLENGDIYFHYGSKYEHIGKKKEIKQFEENRKYYIGSDGYTELQDYKPEFKNMYKCDKSDAWLYAEARYNIIILAT